jgi:ABC-type transporter Mla subunit MlaD
MKQILQAIKSLFRKVEIRNNAAIKEVSNLLETVRAELKRTVANITRLLDSKADKQSPKFEGTVTTDYL